MLSLHTNAASLSTQNSLGSTNKALSTSMTRLGTGLRVNSAMDDAAGLQIATRLNAQTSGMKVAQKNTQNGISMLQTAEGAMDEIKNMLIRMKDLATEAASATADGTLDIPALNAEYSALATEITNIVGNTQFGGAKLLDADKTWTFQTGAASADTYEVSTTQFAMTATATLTKAAANAEIDKLTADINTLSASRSALGAASNRLEHIYNNLGNMTQNTKAAEGRIMDVDYATETSNMTSKQMLMQASTAMLKQSNSMSQMVASLLQ